MTLQAVTIARNTFVESVRQPIYFVLVMLCGVLLVLSTWTSAFSMGYETSAEVSGDNKLLLDIGLATVFVCGMLLAAFIATAVISREIENKTVLTVVSKPIGRSTVIVGKYLGVAAAILVASAIMVAGLLLCIRHGVMSTAADDLDGPVLVFSLGALALALGVAVWGNFFYGWYFSQTAMLVLLPAIALAYLLVLAVSKKWEFQPLSTDFKPQITVACGALVLAILVLSAVATAVSTRLGQVMTIVVCAGVFLMGLLSNHLIGRRAFLNEPIAEIRTVTAEDTQATFRNLGDTVSVELETPPKVPLRPGASFYYGDSPNGVGMVVPPFPPFEGDLQRPTDLFSGHPGGVIVTESDGTRLTVRHIGRDPLPLLRAPRGGDYVFAEPMRISGGAVALWAIIPNMHFFWLVDAVTQNRPVPAGHLVLVAAYALAQILTFLCLGVVLFQKRDVG